MARQFDDCDQEVGNQEHVGDELTALVESTSAQRSALIAQPGRRAVLAWCGMLGLAALSVRQTTPSISALQVANVSDGLIEASNMDAGARMPGLEYINKGYNIFKGNPFPTSGIVDPGFTLYDIFDLQWNPKSDDGVLVPDHVMVSASVACNLEMNTVASNSQASYKHKMDETLGVDISGTRGSFTAAYAGSLDFKHNVKNIIEKKEKLIMSTAQCTVHQGAIDAFNQPNISVSLKRALDQMPVEYGDGSKYFLFIGKVGTHYLETITLGARYGMTASLSESGQETLKEHGMDITHHGAISTSTIEATADSASTRSDSNDRVLTQSIGDMHVVTIGGKPPSGTQSDWLEQSGANAMPIAYKLAPLLDLTHDILQPQIRNNMQRAFGEYCEIHLGLASDFCSNPFDDRECMWDSDCSSHMICNAGACHKGCSTSDDCATPGFCRLGQCETLCQDVRLTWKHDAVHLKDARICPEFQRLNKVECRTYAEVQSFSFVTEDSSGYPTGCYLYSESLVSWNKDTTGSSREGSKPICSPHLMGLDMYTLKPDKMLHGAPTYWSASGMHYIYYCKRSDVWNGHVAGDSESFFIRMQSDDDTPCYGHWNLPTGSPLLKVIGHPDEARKIYALDQWTSGLQIQCSECDSVRLSGFHHGYMNTVFKPIEKYSHGKRLWQDHAESNYLYWCATDDKWLITNDRADADTGMEGGGACRGWAFSSGGGFFDSDWSHKDRGDDTEYQDDWVHHECINA